MNILKYTEFQMKTYLHAAAAVSLFMNIVSSKNNKNKLHKNKLNQFTNRQNTYFTTVVLVVVNLKKTERSVDSIISFCYQCRLIMRKRRKMILPLLQTHPKNQKSGI